MLSAVWLKEVGMEEAGHASKVTEFGCSYRTLNKCFFICFMPLGQFPETFVFNSFFQLNGCWGESTCLHSNILEIDSLL